MVAVLECILQLNKWERASNILSGIKEIGRFILREIAVILNCWLAFWWLIVHNLRQGGHGPGKPGILRDFSEHGKLREFSRNSVNSQGILSTSGKNCNKQSIFSSLFKYICVKQLSVVHLQQVHPWWRSFLRLLFVAITYGKVSFMAVENSVNFFSYFVATLSDCTKYHRFVHVPPFLISAVHLTENTWTVLLPASSHQSL